jgi:hypothetical protein
VTLTICLPRGGRLGADSRFNYSSVATVPIITQSLRRGRHLYAGGVLCDRVAFV